MRHRVYAHSLQTKWDGTRWNILDPGTNAWVEVFGQAGSDPNTQRLILFQELLKNDPTAFSYQAQAMMESELDEGDYPDLKDLEVGDIQRGTGIEDNESEAEAKKRWDDFFSAPVERTGGVRGNTMRRRGNTMRRRAQADSRADEVFDSLQGSDEFPLHYGWNAQAYALYTGISQDAAAMESIEYDDSDGGPNFNADGVPGYTVMDRDELVSWFDYELENIDEDGIADAEELYSLIETGAYDEFFDITGNLPAASSELDGTLQYAGELCYFFS